MKNIKLSSVLILLIFWVITNFEFDLQTGGPLCYRKASGEVTWKLLNPIMLILLISSCIEVYNATRNFKENYLNVLIVAPVLLSFVYFLVRITFIAITM